jgi:predicted DNA-binding protein (UPF0251 family)
MIISGEAMARPKMTRQIRTGLRGRAFKPQGISATELERVELTLDGLEALRLADIEGLYQEEAAQRMGISRATFARVLGAARSCVAEALVQGKLVEIGGGAVTRRPGSQAPCPVHGGRRRRGRGCRCGTGRPGRGPRGRGKQGRGKQGRAERATSSRNEDRTAPVGSANPGR